MTDHTRWYEINAKLGVTATLVDFQLLEGTPPLPLAGGFFHSVARLSERYEAVLTQVARKASGQLPAEVLDEMRAVLQHLQAIRTKLDETIVPALDPEHSGITGPGWTTEPGEYS